MDCQSRVKLAYKIRGELIKAIERKTKSKIQVFQIITKGEPDAMGKNLADGSVLHEELVEITEVDEDYNVIDANEHTDPIFVAQLGKSEIKSDEIEIDYLNENETENEETELFIGDAQDGDGQEDAVSFLLDKKELFKESGTSKGTTARRHRCQVCEKTFMRKSNLIDHLHLHADIRKYTCEYCSKQFVQAGNYRSHLRVS